MSDTKELSDSLPDVDVRYKQFIDSINYLTAMIETFDEEGQIHVKIVKKFLGV